MHIFIRYLGMHQLKIVVYRPWQQQLQWIFYLLFTLYHNAKIKLFYNFPHQNFTVSRYFFGFSQTFQAGSCLRFNKNSQMKSTFRILFYAKWEASDEAKMLPIYVRITINGTKARFSLKIRVSEKIWDAKSGRAIGHSHEALQANSAEKLMRIFKRITTMCFKSGLMAKDPFCDVRLKKVKKDRGYLTRHELELILNYKPMKKRLEKVK